MSGATTRSRRTTCQGDEKAGRDRVALAIFRTALTVIRVQVDKTQNVFVRKTGPKG